MKLNRKRSRELAKHVAAENKACWRNALLACVSLGDDARYVEGWVVTDFGIVVEHGWVQQHGYIIDPTPTYHAKGRHNRYFAGLRLTAREALDANENAESLPFSKFGQPAYHEAYRRAHVAAYGVTPEELHDRLSAVAKSMEGEHKA